MQVVITRASEDSAAFKTLLQTKGLEAFELPCIEFTEPSDDYKALDGAIRKNHHFDWIFFLSRKAAEVFFNRLLELGGHLFHLSPHLKIACIGRATADYVEQEIGFPVNFVPSKFNSDILVQEFIDKYQGDHNLQIILPRAEIDDDSLIEALEQSGFIDVELCPTYQTTIPDLAYNGQQELLHLIDSDESLYFTFTSSEIVRNFKTLLGAEALAKLKSRQDFYIMSIGPKCTQAIQEELKEIINDNFFEAPESTISGLVELIISAKCVTI